ncbi:MAG: hypothetical protein QOG87_3029 [Actinomycetota bacterium]|jgi:hypothetical protein
MQVSRGAAGLAAVLALALLGPTASAAERPRSAWWNRANVGLLPSFGSPDVGERQLLVEGIAANEEGWVAVAGLAFALDGPVTDATLTLVASDVRPASQPPMACALTAGFTPVAGGPWSDVPAHDCGRSIVAEAAPDGGRFVMRGLAALAADGELRILVVPNGPGRFVFDAPGAEALDASRAPSPGSDLSGGGQGLGELGPIGGGALPSDLAPPVPDASAPGVSPVEDATEVPSADASGSFAAAGQFEAPTDDGSTRAATAAVIAIALCAFTAMQRGGGTRLRPARVSWRSSAPADS